MAFGHVACGYAASLLLAFLGFSLLLSAGSSTAEATAVPNTPLDDQFPTVAPPNISAASISIDVSSADHSPFLEAVPMERLSEGDLLRLESYHPGGFQELPNAMKSSQQPGCSLSPLGVAAVLVACRKLFSMVHL